MAASINRWMRPSCDASAEPIEGVGLGDSDQIAERDPAGLLDRASGRVDDRRQDRLEPWPLEEAVAYTPEYLAGYSALRSDVEPETGLAVAERTMAKVIERDCRDDIGGDEQRVQSVDTEYANVMYKLPVWVVA